MRLSSKMFVWLPIGGLIFSPINQDPAVQKSVQGTTSPSVQHEQSVSSEQITPVIEGGIADEKVDPQVLKDLQTQGKTNFIVVLNEKADLSKAEVLKTKKEKEEYVFQALRETAQRTQAQLKELLDSRGISYRAYFLANKILVHDGTQELLEEILSQDGIEQIITNHPFPASDVPLAAAPEDNRTFINMDDVLTLVYTDQGITLRDNHSENLTTSLVTEGDLNQQNSASVNTPDTVNNSWFEAIENNPAYKDEIAALQAAGIVVVQSLADQDTDKIEANGVQGEPDNGDIAQQSSGARALDTFWAGNLNGAIFNVNTGNVGIGDNSPVAKLTVGDGDKFQVTDMGLVLSTYGLTSPSYSFGGDPDTGLYHPFAADNLSLMTNGVERLTMDAFGTVWVNKTNNSRDFIVNSGTAQFTVDNTGRVYASGGTMSHPTYSFNNDVNTGILNEGNDVLKFITSGTAAMTIDANENVGIGINMTPNARFTVQNLFQVVDGGRVLGPNGGPATPTYSFTSDPVTGMYSDGVGNLKFSVAGDSKMSMTNAGVNINNLITEIVHISDFTPRIQLDDKDATGITDMDAGIDFYHGATLSGSLKLYSSVLSMGTVEAGGQIWLKSGQNLEAMRIDANQNVGIGDTAPAEKLTVGIGGKFRVNASGIVLAPDGSATNPTYSFTSDSNTGMYHPSADSIRFTTAGIDRLTVASTGNVGIGNTNPSGKFSVGPNSEFRVTNSGLVRSVNGSATSPTYSFSSDTDTGLYGSGSNLLKLTTGGTDRMTIDGNGNVGIGTTTPGAGLHLKDKYTIHPYQSWHNYIELEDNDYAAITYKETDTNSGWLQGFHGANDRIDWRYLDDWSAGTGTYVMLLHKSDGLRLFDEDASINSYGNLNFEGNGDGGFIIDSNTGGTFADLQLQTNHIARIFIEAANGNVGIGTTTPDEKLTVNGTVKAKEVIVTQNGWADYVFGKNYPLVPLEDLEKQIQELGHLPRISSALDVEKEGVNVGTMQAKLLEKIEELTLYVIELKKEINQLKKENQFIQKIQ